MSSKRKPRSKATPEEPQTLDELLKELSEHGLNFVVGEPLWERLVAHGLDVIPILLERTEKGDKHFKLVDIALKRILENIAPDLRGWASGLLQTSLARTFPRERRIEAIKAFTHAFAQDSLCQERILHLALDPGEDIDVRTTALATLAKMEPAGVLAERLLAILDLDREQWLKHERMCDAAFLCLRQHALRLPSKRLRVGLEPFLTHANPRLRSRAIALVGAYADVDFIEHLFALPDAPAHREEILDAVAKISSRPINLLSLRPEAFEAFIARLLTHMGFLDVKVGCFTQDGGVDATCHQFRQGFSGVEREEWIVQCKRYKEKPIDEATIRQFVDTITARRAHRGLFVTTSSYTGGAMAFADSQQNLKIISGEQLLNRLMEVFKTKRYSLDVHA
ncbi:restriction endonuclease [Nannocystis sp. SCPEA4]|uniref:restriction endonuclease n=1 Tax=Nannocystis sp. SCPEA4 TaxID=2996787 RepID=UPI00227214F8|nr:restriction endonuclease [Nannocystis sp. SCPEA4]MCY1062782.1 restriction endonuclease [Nannocystis sp. SCPEA4]